MKKIIKILKTLESFLLYTLFGYSDKIKDDLEKFHPFTLNYLSSRNFTHINNNFFAIYKFSSTKVKNIIYSAKYEHNKSAHKIIGFALAYSFKSILILFQKVCKPQFNYELKFKSQFKSKSNSEFQSNSQPIIEIIITPIPSSKKRIKERGFDHLFFSSKYCYYFLKNFLRNNLNNNDENTNYFYYTNLCENIEIYFCPKILKRKKETIQQSKLNKKDRIKLSKNVFTYNKNKYNINEDQNKKLKFLKNKRRIFLIIDDVITTGSTFNEAIKILNNEFPQDIKIALAFCHQKLN